jgi:hypothetical protein
MVLCGREKKKCIKHLRWEQNDALAQGMKIVSVNKICLVCEMPSPYNIVIIDLDSNFAVAAVGKSETCICAKCLAEPKA